MVVEDPRGGTGHELTIQRQDVDAELGYFVFVYRADDGRILTFNEAFDELTPQMAEGLEGLPLEEQVIDGGDVQEFIFESGVYESIAAEGRIVTKYTDGQTRWTNDQLRERVFPTSSHGSVGFEDWRTAQVAGGQLRAVDVLQYIDYESDDGDEETVLTERVIID